ncbi:hypothetical protein TWF730_008754 [Orbilia blumenaviensis]|uniref:RING-type domain-containing protein n=1 Tax=Orbilia blumenaviensis TaxID=1796055 RepID=A0AAV9V5X5_9PEZI
MSSSQDPAASQPSTEFVHPSQGSQASQTTTTNPRRVPAPANPINPLKRQLSENMEALIAQAKASKTSAGSTAAQAAQSETIYDKLERELTCSICCELFKDPITLLDCLHNFCGSCIVPWGRRNSTCPSCRGDIRECRDAFALKPLIEMLVKEKPELGISQNELDGVRTIYEPGQQVSFGEHGSDSDEDSEDQEDDEDEDQDDDEEAVEARNAQSWEPCPCCTQGENANPLYTCSDPILTDDRSYDWQVEFKSHKKCASCAATVPYDLQNDALKPSYCACCGVTYCGGIVGTCPSDPNSEFLHSMRVASLYGQTPHYANWFNNNSYEQDALKRWVESDTNNHTWQSLGVEMREWLFQKHPTGIPGTSVVPVVPDSYVCKNCLPGMFDRNLTDFLISERERLGWTDARSRCWYGKECRTQRHNPDHCARLSHVWNQVPVEERREVRPARPAHATYTGSVRNSASTPQPVGAQPAGNARTETPLPTVQPSLLRFPSNDFPPSSPSAPSLRDIFSVPFPSNNVFSEGNDDPADAGPSN